MHRRVTTLAPGVADAGLIKEPLLADLRAHTTAEVVEHAVGVQFSNYLPRDITPRLFSPIISSLPSSISASWPT